MSTEISEQSHTLIQSAQKENEIKLMVESRYPILYITTWEEYRALSTLKEVAKKTKRGLMRWTSTEGLVEIPLDDSKSKPATRLDAMAILDQVISYQGVAIFVLQDYHHFLNEPTIIRRLRDVVARLRSALQTIVILSPVFKMPVELEKDITLIDYDVPSQEELALVLDRISEQAKRRSGNILLQPTEREQLIKAMQGLTESQAENVLTRCLVQDNKLDAEDIQIVLREKEQIIKKSGLLEFYSSVDELRDVGGLGILKDWFKKRKENFSERAKAFSLESPKGVLLIGVPGCGKSLCAKSLAAEWDKPLLRLDVGRIFGGLVGQSEENMRMAIKVAESVAPVILWIDEIEKGFAGLQGRGDGGGVVSHVFGTLITWMQEKTKPVFVVATANDISQLPPELIRKGRFDEMFFVDLPSQQEREEIFKIHIQKRHRNPELFDLWTLAARSERFSGAEIESIVKSALNDAFFDSAELSMDYLVANIEATTPLSDTMATQINALRNWAATRCRFASPERHEVSQNVTFNLSGDRFELGTLSSD